jgi:hypothetical protein
MKLKNRELFSKVTICIVTFGIVVGFFSAVRAGTFSGILQPYYPKDNYQDKKFEPEKTTAPGKRVRTSSVHEDPSGKPQLKNISISLYSTNVSNINKFFRSDIRTFFQANGFRESVNFWGLRGSVSSDQFDLFASIGLPTSLSLTEAWSYTFQLGGQFNFAKETLMTPSLSILLAQDIMRMSGYLGSLTSLDYYVYETQVMLMMSKTIGPVRGYAGIGPSLATATGKLSSPFFNTDQSGLGPVNFQLNYLLGFAFDVFGFDGRIESDWVAFNSKEERTYAFCLGASF